MNGLKKSVKIGKTNGVPNLPTAHTGHVKGNMGSLDAPQAFQLFTFGPMVQGTAMSSGS